MGQFGTYSLLTLCLASGLSYAQTTPLTVVTQYMQAWNQHDSTKAGTFFAEKVSYYDASVGEPVIGKQQATQQVVKAFVDAVPDLHWVMTSKPVYNGDTIAFQWRFTGTNDGAWAGTPATHKKIHFDGVSFIKVSQGKITYQGDYYDSKKLSDQLK
ncbi:ester cyclase [Rosenbergiella sp. S61]|uniref:Ester cyclase n=1 Tax=Rosenbergiella gaditana TaxID=2726987 RepID=A0ABS5SUQ8_9GAMM|nr:ester cyclase [Rosenbergiella gaditana]MBT0723851.1 ester cyclase [Rosenbergiella gaditana]